jgi:hypothetical protein
MIYLKKFSVACPEGYLPIQRPKTWNVNVINAYAPKPPVLQITLSWESIKDEEALIESMTERLMNLFEVSSVCMSQLAKSPFNDFLIGVSDSLMADVKAQCSKIKCKGMDVKIGISVSDLIIFQKDQKSSRV